MLTVVKSSMTCFLSNAKASFLSLNFTQFQPTHGLLVQLVIEQRQTLGFLGQFVYAECTAAQGFFYLFLFFLQCGNLFFQLFEFLPFLERHAALVVQADSAWMRDNVNAVANDTKLE